ncbi:Nmad5 family putative nucleotide modification protein [Acinetobacter sp. P8-3-8]|uniref:Nmad5 family putative nucleotide modification protein n=1 Tax=Acinetobacter sp. P8-3-8 TaxID=1029823 RepID=UPI00024856F9|nr:Nmad5 family putative nucleotide modification protein [Acinetobacter sp. P8-3-8]
MSRLTKSLREAMLETILSHAFDAKQKNAKQQEIIAGEKVYQDIYGSHLIAMESLPKGFLEKSSYFYISIAGRSHCIRLSESRLVGCRHDNSYFKAKLYVGDEAIAIEYQKAVDVCEDFDIKRKQMSREINPVLESVHTFKKLWEVWPESKSLLEKFEEKPTIAILPAVQVNKLNAALGLPVSEVKEPQQ